MGGREARIEAAKGGGGGRGGGRGEAGGREGGREGSYFLLSRLIYIYKECMLTMEDDVKAEKETENLPKGTFSWEEWA